MFHSPHDARERILLYGEAGVGKSRAYIDIARVLKATKSPASVYIIDNDKSAKWMAESANLDLQITEVYEWPEYISALKTIIKTIKRDDWLILDLASEAWPAVQSYYTEQVFGNDIGAYFLQVKKDMGKQTEFDGWTDWKVINKLYSDFMRPFVYRSPCHILATSTCDPITRKKSPDAKVGDDKETVSVFGSVGFKPEGQKRLKHQFNTTIFLHKTNVGLYVATSVKDRERPLIISQPIKSFSIDYLKTVAGWQL